MGIKSVTEILNIINKPALIYWANKIGLQGIKLSEYKKYGTSIGTLAHAIIKFYCGGKKINWKKYDRQQIIQACKCSKMFFNWIKEQKDFIPIASELSLELNYKGIIDLIVIVNEKLTLIDFKTCNIYNEAKYQVGAYYNLAKENGYNIEQVLIIKIGKKDDFEIVKVDNIELAFEVFNYALKLSESIDKFNNL